MYIAFIHDCNLSATVQRTDNCYVFDTIREAEGVIRDAGSWRNYVNVYGIDTGAMLLSEPQVELYRVPKDTTALIYSTTIITDDMYTQPDVILETGPRGGVRREW